MADPIYKVIGGHYLEGCIQVGGAKNAALPVLAAAVTCDGPCKISNVPNVSDIKDILNIIRETGAMVSFEDTHTVIIDPRGVSNTFIKSPQAEKIRASYYLIGALLGKFGNIDIAIPGGCNLGNRPIDLHQKGFELMGAVSNFYQDGKSSRISFSTKTSLKACTIFLDVVSVGATINLMIAAAKIPGRTVLKNTATEPHVVDVANFLNRMGARIKGAGTNSIRIDGVEKLPAGKDYTLIPDQIEAGTFMIAPMIAGGDVTVQSLIPVHLNPLSEKLMEMGGNITLGDDYIRVKRDPEKTLASVFCSTAPWPGFPTDLQSQLLALMTQCQGISKMEENVWSQRYKALDYFKAMGANLNLLDDKRTVQVRGKTQLYGTEVVATDLRAGAALILAGLAAEGCTLVTKAQSVQRGYEEISKKLRGIGAEIEEL